MLKEQFIENMNKKYGSYGAFDFSTMIFKSSKMTVICNKCGIENTKSAIRHIECTCSKCYSNMSQRSDNNTFIKKVEEKFGKDKFKFDKLNYTNAITKVEIFCCNHQGYFLITPNKFLTGNGCNICNKNIAYTSETFIKKVKENYGEMFDFTKTVYKNKRTKVLVYCINGDHDWEVDPNTLIKGKTGCGRCSGKGGRSNDEFITEAKNVHGEKYDYSTVNYTSSLIDVNITCKEHGIFIQSPKSHLYGRGCPKCGKYGYQPSNPGYFYVQKLVNENKTIYKYGITGDMKRRVYEQSRDSVFEHEVLVERYFEDGQQPLVLENFIKRYVDSGISSVEELPSGFTETFDEKYLETVLEIVNKFE